MTRIDKIKDFLKGKSTNYEAKGEMAEVSSCAICMEEFKDVSLQIAQLNCSKKHIFHTECLVAWVERSNECPMCREPIYRD